MKTSIKNEIVHLVVVAIPFIYLAFIWNSLPDIVPTHWNAAGEVDAHGSKTTLFLFPGLSLFVYLTMLSVPLLDPRKKLDNMGNKFHIIKLLMVLLMSALGVGFLYTIQNNNVDVGKMVFVIIGFFFIILGNYMKTIKPNYFVGIRTPWTLESDYVWKETHKLGGVIWMIGGFIVVIFSLLLDSTTPAIFLGGNLTITMVLAFIPMIYSYKLYQKEKSQTGKVA